MTTRLRVLGAAIGAGAALMTTASPASANEPVCNPWYGPSNVEVCVFIGGTTGSTYASLQAYSGKFGDYTLAVEECRTDLTNCGAFSAKSSSPYTSYDTTTSKKCAYGHIYRTHATWTDIYGGRYVDVRTAWTACQIP
jgi:hypothetical protein